MKKFALVALFAVVASVAWAKEKPAYQVGTFIESRQVSDGTYSHASCGAFSCSGSAYSASHNVHEVETPGGVYTIEAPVSVGGTLAVAMLNGASPTIHKGWFMDQLHEGDKILFSAQCNKHNRCTIRLPNPDKPDKVVETQGFFSPAAAKTNAGVLCGTGKLTPSVEAQVCNQPPVVAAAIEPTPAPAKAESAAPAQSAPSAPIVAVVVAPAPSDASIVNSDQMSLGEAARQAKAKKAAER